MIILVPGVVLLICLIANFFIMRRKACQRSSISGESTATRCLCQWSSVDSGAVTAIISRYKREIIALREEALLVVDPYGELFHCCAIQPNSWSGTVIQDGELHYLMGYPSMSGFINHLDDSAPSLGELLLAVQLKFYILVVINPHYTYQIHCRKAQTSMSDFWRAVEEVCPELDGAYDWRQRRQDDRMTDETLREIVRQLGWSMARYSHPDR